MPGHSGSLRAAETPVGERDEPFVTQQDPVVRLGQSLLAVGAEPVSVADAIVVRELLEPRIIVDAAKHRTQDDIAAITTQSASLADVADDPDVFVHAVWELHRR